MAALLFSDGQIPGFFSWRDTDTGVDNGGAET